MNKEDLLKKIDSVLDTIRPYLKSDGGDIFIEELTDNMVLKVKLLGACENCPFSLHTLKAGVEQTIKKNIPEIKEVIASE
jgi:Fe-S cluster biogenesis protein NfuA